MSLPFKVGAPVTVRTTVKLQPVKIGPGTGGGEGGTGEIIQASVWTGEGPPHLVIGASVGDEYIDTISGTIYRLDPGA